MKPSAALAFLAALGICHSAPAQTRFSTLYTFTNGSPGQLISVGGVIYGAFGGSTPIGSICGGIFGLQPPASPGGVWTERILYSFGPFGADIGSAGNNLIAGPAGSFYFVGGDGTLYGATSTFEPGLPFYGTIFTLATK